MTSEDQRHEAGYAPILLAYGGVTTALALALRKRSNRMQPLSMKNLLLYGLATEHLSRVITKDSVTSVVRSPFTEFEGDAGEGEVNEKVTGHGVHHAVGELLTCPFCMAQWVATGLVAGNIAAPSLTTAVVSVSALARLSDFIQLLYNAAKESLG